MFRISAVTKAHTADVKAVACSVLHDGTAILVTGSRDSKVKLWSLTENSPSLLAEHSEHTGFVNAVAVIAPAEESDDNHTLVASGGVDNIVYIYDLQSMDVTGALIGHSSNVCHLASSDSGLLLSCSWDKSARVWSGTLEAHVLQGHSEAVWGGCFVSSDHVVTASADKSLILWHNGQMLRSFIGHTDVARSVAMLPASMARLGDFVSVGNDGAMLFWRLDESEPVHAVSSHSSFIYTVACHDSFIATAGEDRTVKIWSLSSSGLVECVQSLPIPATSVWSLAVDVWGNVHCGCSDGYVYSFCRSPDGAPVDDGVAAEFNKLLSESQIASQQVGSSQNAQSAEILKAPGKSAGQVVLVRSETSIGTVEAHQWDGHGWVKIGDVVDGPGTDGASSRPQHKGTEYDFVFDVELESGTSYKLPFNRGDNPYNAAAKFLAENDIGQDMQDQVVDFLIKNTSGAVIERQTTGMFNPYMEAPSQRPIQTHGGEVYRDCNVEGIMRKLAEFSALEDAATRMSDQQLSLVHNCLANSSHAARSPALLELVKCLRTWDSQRLFPVIDAIRVLVLNADAGEIARTFTVLSSRRADMSGNSPAVLTASRLLCNALRVLAKPSANYTSDRSDLIDLAVYFAGRCYALHIKDMCVPVNVLAAAWDFAGDQKGQTLSVICPTMLGRIRNIDTTPELEKYLAIVIAITPFANKSLASNIASELEILRESGRVPAMSSALDSVIRKLRIVS